MSRGRKGSNEQGVISHASCPCPRPHLGGRPVDLTLAFLLLQHLVEYGHDPVLKQAVVAVGHQHVTDAVQATQAQLRA